MFAVCLIPFLGFAQPDYNIITNNGAHTGNLFFHVGGQPVKPVNILDSSGTLIYTQNFDLKGWGWKVNLNNKITFFDRLQKRWLVMDSLKNIVDSVSCQNGYIADNHDFIALQNGNYILFSYDQQDYATDSISNQGSSNSTVFGLVIQELDSNHNLVFEWLSWDHFFLSNYSQIDYNNLNIDFLHCNAIDIDEDGHLLISNRTISEITKIHRTTGEIIWRFGGDQSDFSFENDYPFSKQHCIKSLGNNHYIMYDNGNYSDDYTGGIKRSRGVEYVLNLDNHTATKVWEFVHQDSLFTPSIGSIQRLNNGNTLINFGNNQIVNRGSVITEVSPNNEVVFEMEFNTGQNVYCANKYDWSFYNEPIANTIESKLDEAFFSIYPNPSDENISVKFFEKYEGYLKYEIFNHKGALLLENKIPVSSNQENIRIKHGLPSGNYILKLSSEKKSAFTKLSAIK